MVRVFCEAEGLFGPCFADELLWREAAQRLEPAGIIVCVDEVAEMRFELPVRIVMVAFDDGLLDGAGLRST